MIPQFQAIPKHKLGQHERNMLASVPGFDNIVLTPDEDVSVP